MPSSKLIFIFNSAPEHRTYFKKLKNAILAMNENKFLLKNMYV